jgi:hypothetical protein
LAVDFENQCGVDFECESVSEPMRVLTQAHELVVNVRAPRIVGIAPPLETHESPPIEDFFIAYVGRQKIA